jgi:hypothetical protein
MPSLLHLVDDPVPMSGGLDGDLAVRWQRLKKSAKSISVMFHPSGFGQLAVSVDGYKDRVPLMNIAPNDVSHECLLLMQRSMQPAKLAALSYDHPWEGCCRATAGCYMATLLWVHGFRFRFVPAVAEL